MGILFDLYAYDSTLQSSQVKAIVVLNGWGVCFNPLLRYYQPLLTPIARICFNRTIVNDSVRRINGDHCIITKSGIAEIINLQPLKDGNSKSYQVKQVRSIILSNKLHKEKEDA